MLRVKGKKADVGLLASVLAPAQLSRQTAERGLFRDDQRLLPKGKLSSRTVALGHREAEGSLLALQLLLAGAVQTHAGQPLALPGVRGGSCRGCGARSRRRGVASPGNFAAPLLVGRNPLLSTGGPVGYHHQ